jgi:ABC-type lipoprotein export system ATPase subunit
MKEILRLIDVVKWYDSGERDIRDVSLTFYEGEFVAIYGLPGSGKSILSRLIAGMEKLSDGCIFVWDQLMHAENDKKSAVLRCKHIGIMQHSPSFLPGLTILENIALPLAVKNMDKTDRLHKAAAWLQRVGMTDRRHNFPQGLSSLEKQKISLARAMVKAPEILLVDGITGNLSTSESLQFMELLNKIVRQERTTLVLFTDNQDIARLADRWFLLKDGMIQEEVYETIN